MSILGWIILFCFLGGAISVLAAALIMLVPARLRAHLLPHFISYAIGALLGAAFLALLPHALVNPVSPDNLESTHAIMLTVLLGVLVFFLLEKMVLWRHCHSHECELHGAEDDHAHQSDPAVGTLILLGDGIHNLVDGVLIAAAFLTDIHLGIVTALAVAAHEIPQEIGDFSILLHSGYSRARALWYNILVSLTTVVGGVLAYLWLAEVQQMIPYVLAIAAASFIYVAMADLLPGLHKRVQVSITIQQVTLILVGVVTIYLTHSTLH